MNDRELVAAVEAARADRAAASARYAEAIVAAYRGRAGTAQELADELGVSKAWLLRLAARQRTADAPSSR
jgi:hypothetical protein